jgi:hypothetical protein
VTPSLQQFGDCSAVSSSLARNLIYQRLPPLSVNSKQIFFFSAPAWRIDHTLFADDDTALMNHIKTVK